jgi:hypothetical protein
VVGRAVVATGRELASPGEREADHDTLDALVGCVADDLHQIELWSGGCIGISVRDVVSDNHFVARTDPP